MQRRARPARGARRHRRRRRRAGRAAARPERRRVARTSRRSTRTPAPAASRSCSAVRCCTASARRSSPTSAAAASATGRSTSTWTCCAAFGAIVDKLRAASASPPRTACTAPSIELPYPSVGATEQVLLTAVRAEGITELQERGDRARDHGSHRRPAEDGRDHLGRAQPRHPASRASTRCAATTTAASSTATRPPRWACAALATDGDIFVGGAQAAGDAHVPQRLPQGGRRVRHPRGRHPLSAAGGALKPVVVETDVHPGFMTDWQQPLIVALTQAEGRLDRPRDRLREPLRLHRGARADGRRHRRAPRGHRQSRPPRSAPRDSSRRPSSPARRRCTAPTSRCPTSAAASATSSRRSPPRASRPSATSGIIRRGYEKLHHEARRPRRGLRSSKGNGSMARVADDLAAAASAAAEDRADPRSSGCWRARRPADEPRSRGSRSIDGDKLPREGAYVLAPNHYSEIDPLVVGARRVEAGPRAALHGEGEPVPGARARLDPAQAPGRSRSQRGLVARGSGPARRRPRRSSRTAAASIVYPEGTLTRDPDLWPMRGKTGAVRLALERDIPLIPMAHWGAQHDPAPLRRSDQLWPRAGRSRDQSAIRSTSPPSADRSLRAGALADGDRRAHGRDRRCCSPSCAARRRRRALGPAEHDQKETGRFESLGCRDDSPGARASP